MLGNGDVKDLFLHQPPHTSHPLRLPHLPFHLRYTTLRRSLPRRNVAIPRIRMFALSWQILSKMPMQPSFCAPQVRRPTQQARRG